MLLNQNTDLTVDIKDIIIKSNNQTAYGDGDLKTIFILELLWN